jgi:hypothetical protein
MTFDRKFMVDIAWLTIKIIVILMLSNAGHSFFVYQNF